MAPLKGVRFATASTVMKKNVVTIDGKKTVADAIKLMAGVRRAPVFDGKDVIGIPESRAHGKRGVDAPGCESSGLRSSYCGP
jgi:predicted transcriptional regulator